MPNTPVRAAAEGMPAFNRRKALTLTGSGVAAALATMAISKPAPAAVQEAACENCSPSLS